MEWRRSKNIQQFKQPGLISDWIWVARNREESNMTGSLLFGWNNQENDGAINSLMIHTLSNIIYIFLLSELQDYASRLNLPKFSRIRQALLHFSIILFSFLICNTQYIMLLPILFFLPLDYKFIGNLGYILYFQFLYIFWHKL